MRFTTTPTALKAAYAAVCNAIPKKASMPILENILFRPATDGSVINIIASDGDLTSSFPLVTEDATDLAAFTVPAGILKDYISSIATDLPITFEVIGREVCISDIFCEGYDGAFKFVSAADAAEYPEHRPLADDAKHFCIPAERYCDALAAAMSYCANDELRPIMCGVYSDFQASRVTIAASDSKKLFREHITLPSTGLAPDEHYGVTLPKKLVSIISSVIDRTGDIELVCDGKSICIKQGSVVIFGRCVEGRYPRYEAIIPRNNHRIAITHRQQLISAIKRVLIASNSTTQCIAFSFDGQASVMLESQDVDYSTHAQLRIPTIEQTDSNLRIGMRGTFLKDVLESFRHCDRVRISMFDPTRAVTITATDSDDRLCLIMPMQLVDF